MLIFRAWATCGLSHVISRRGNQWWRRENVGQRLKFGSAFLSSSWESKIALFFLTFPYPVPVPKNCVIFIGCNFKSRASEVGLHKEIQSRIAFSAALSSPCRPQVRFCYMNMHSLEWLFFEVPVVPMHETAAKMFFYLYEKVYKPAIGGPKNIGKAITVKALPRA